MESLTNENGGAACSSYLPELDVLRHRRPKKDDFSKLPLSKSVEDRIAQETIQEIDNLNERCQLEGKKGTEQEVEEIRLSVQAKHQDGLFTSQMKVALLLESERILKILRTRGFGPVLDDSTLKQRKAEYIAQLDLKCFPEARHRHRNPKEHSLARLPQAGVHVRPG